MTGRFYIDILKSRFYIDMLLIYLNEFSFNNIDLLTNIIHINITILPRHSY